MKLAPDNDDIWFWSMSVLMGTKTKIPENAMPKIVCVDVETELFGVTLWSLNCRGRSELQRQQVLKEYPIIQNKLIQEIATFKPYISIVMIVKNRNKILECIKNLLFNEFVDFELIIVNIGERFELESLPHNFKLINFPDASISSARNLGLNKSSGNFIIFKDHNNFFLKDALANIARISSTFEADVIHCSAHLKVEQNFITRLADDEFGTMDDGAFIWEFKSRQARAVQWLQGKLSRRIDTKIFKRSFLLENKFKFDEDEADFMFSCLVEAEKYLLLSRAFLIGED